MKQASISIDNILSNHVNWQLPYLGCLFYLFWHLCRLSQYKNLKKKQIKLSINHNKIFNSTKLVTIVLQVNTLEILSNLFTNSIQCGRYMLSILVWLYELSASHLSGGFERIGLFMLIVFKELNSYFDLTKIETYYL